MVALLREWSFHTYKLEFIFWLIVSIGLALCGITSVCSTSEYYIANSSAYSWHSFEQKVVTKLNAEEVRILEPSISWLIYIFYFQVCSCFPFHLPWGKSKIDWFLLEYIHTWMNRKLFEYTLQCIIHCTESSEGYFRWCIERETSE